MKRHSKEYTPTEQETAEAIKYNGSMLTKNPFNYKAFEVLNSGVCFSYDIQTYRLI